MIDQALMEAYRQVLREHGEARSDAPVTHDQREHPRLKVHAPDLAISSLPEFALVDMSATGMAVDSNYPMQPGEMVRISLGQVLSLEAEVVGCQLVEAPDEYTDGTFRLHCRFMEDLRGMELLVKVVTRT